MQILLHLFAHDHHSEPCFAPRAKIVDRHSIVCLPATLPVSPPSADIVATLKYFVTPRGLKQELNSLVSVTIKITGGLMVTLRKRYYRNDDAAHF